VFNFHELIKKVGIVRGGILPLKISLELIYMIFFSVPRISHMDALNNSSDRGFSVLCGLSRVTHHTLLLSFIKSFTREMIETFIEGMGIQATKLGLIIGEILNIDTHTSPFYGEAEVKKTKVSSKGKVMKAVTTAFVQDQITQRMIYFTSDFKDKTIPEMLLVLIEKVEKITGKRPKHLLFDLGFWNGTVVESLNDLDIKFTTLYKRYQMNVENLVKIIFENKFKRIEFTAQGRKYKEAWAIDTKTSCIAGYSGKELRIVILSVMHEDKLKTVTFLSSDFESTTVELIEGYARRWRIENWFAGPGSYTHLDALTSPKADISDATKSFKVLVDDLMTLLKHDVGKEYMDMDSKRFLREVLGDGRLRAYVKLDRDMVVVTFEKFDTQYLLEPLFENLNEKLEAMGVDPKVPWLNGHKIEIRFNQ